MNYDRKAVPITSLVGKIFSRVINNGDVEIHFTCADTGDTFHMEHRQDCCENVYITDICGDLSDLVGTPILSASEDMNTDDWKALGEYDESYTWTFYNISTIKGTVTIRWYGTSNGYYSESVDLLHRTNKQEASR